ncbi:hypothetical protein ABK040_009361 [Willaertia magna]
MAAINQPLQQVDIAFIGGTSLSKLSNLNDIQILPPIQTPFGTTSSPILIGKIKNLTVAFLSRHGEFHHLTPTEIPYRANICGLKMLGVKHIVSFTAVGSLKEEIAPKDFVLIEQFIDRTKFRETENTFYGTNGIVAHVSFGDSVCNKLSKLVWNCCQEVKSVKSFNNGTYVCIEGPCFSSRAESKMYINWGCDVVGMTCLQEAKLCREAEIAYACVATVTDYDSWKEDEAPVTQDEIAKTLGENGENAKKLIEKICENFTPIESDSHSAMKFALLKPVSTWDKEQKEKYKCLLEKYY